MTINLTKLCPTTADAAQRLRIRNLGAVLNRKALPEPGGRLTGWQQRTLEALRFAGLSGYSQPGGTVKVSLLRPAPFGDYTEEWATLVTPRDLTAHLGNAYAT